MHRTLYIAYFASYIKHVPLYILSESFFLALVPVSGHPDPEAKKPLCRFSFFTNGDSGLILCGLFGMEYLKASCLLKKEIILS